MSVVDNLSIGYAPYSSDFSAPGDRRRFVYYANSKAIDFEIAKPENEYDIVYVTDGADITLWSRYDKSKAVIVYDLIDSYLATPVLSFYGLFRGLAKYLSGKHKYCQLNQKKSIESMCKRADIVICSTEEQKNHIRRYCDDVRIILDVKSEYHNYRMTLQPELKNNELNIAWEGVPHNVKSFAVIREALSILSKQYQINLHLMTALKYKKYMNKYVTKHTINEVKKYINSDGCDLDTAISAVADAEFRFRASSKNVEAVKLFQLTHNLWDHTKELKSHNPWKYFDNLYACKEKNETQIHIFSCNNL
jgi:hypothetical protein